MMKTHHRIAMFVFAALCAFIATAQTVPLPAEGIAIALDNANLTLQLWNGEEFKLKRTKELEVLPPGAVLKLEKITQKEAEPESIKVTIIGASLAGTIKEIANDQSTIIVAVRKVATPGKNWTISAVTAAKPMEPEVNQSLQIGNDLRPLVKAMRSGDGIRAAYKRDGDVGRETNHVQSLAWQSESLSPIARWLSLFCAATLLLIVAFIVTGGRPTHLFLGLDNRYSSSKFQTVVWFWVVISAYLAIISHRIMAAGWSYIGGVDIPQNLLILSGISVLTFAASKAITTAKLAADNTTSANAKPSASAPKAGDLVNDDLNRTDLGDFQMVVITCLAVVMYAISTLQFMEIIEFRRVVTMPEVDATLLAIFGLGQAGYLGKKMAGDAGAGMTSDQATARGTEMSVAAKNDADRALAAQSIAKTQQADAKVALDAAANELGKAMAQLQADKALTAAKSAGAASVDAAAAAKAAETHANEAMKVAGMWSKDIVAVKPTQDASTKAQVEWTKAKAAAADAAAAAAAADMDAKEAQAQVMLKK